MSTANPFAKSAATATATPPAADAIGTAESTKPAAATTPKVSGDPFGTPAGPGSGEKITDYLGELLLVKPHEVIEGMSTSIGTADAVSCDVVVLSGESQGHKAERVLVFQTALSRDLRGILNGPQSLLLGRLGKGTAKQGKSAPFIFEQPNEEDRALALQYLEVNSL